MLGVHPQSGWPNPELLGLERGETMATTTSAAVAAAPDDAKTGSALLEIQDLQIYFRSKRGVARVVDGANLTVGRGEIVGIAGESGCGKTTLVEAILQIIRFPNRMASGSVNFHGKSGTSVDLMKLSPAEFKRFRWQHISYIPQGSMNSLNPVMRIGDQIVDGMTAHGLGANEARQKVPGLLEQVGLEERVARLYPHELSGGMKQRVIIAAAVSMDPELIIADEPTTALDVNVQRAILETLARLRREFGIAILIVSHDLPMHAQLVDRIGVMYAGQIVEVGDVRPLMKESLHPYTKGLLEAVPTIGGERRRVEGMGGTTPSPLNWPEGCRFRPRCPHAMPICEQQGPLLAEVQPGRRRGIAPEMEIGPNRLVACHLYPESTREATS